MLFFFFHWCKGSALSNLYKLYLRADLENSVSCWPWGRYLRKCISPSVQLWGKVPCGRCRPSFILEQMVRIVSCGTGADPGVEECETAGFIFLLGLSENVFLHSLVPQHCPVLEPNVCSVIVAFAKIGKYYSCKVLETFKYICGIYICI